MKPTTPKKTFAKLGYTKMDTLEIVTLLNRLLANYSVFQQKLRKFYWNITGQDFFNLYGQFHEMYVDSTHKTENIAERIRLFGQNPLSTLGEYLEIATIGEEKASTTSYEMAGIILENIRELIDNMEEGIDATKKNSDNGTEYMLKSFIHDLERDHWKLTAWMKQNT